MKRRISEKKRRAVREEWNNENKEKKDTRFFLLIDLIHSTNKNSKTNINLS